VELERVGDEKVRLRDHSYRWIVTKRFSISGPQTRGPAEVLASLLRHPAYRDHFASPDSETDAPIHGPYRLDSIAIDSFNAVTGEEAAHALRAWLDQYGGVSPEQAEGDLEAVRRLLSDSTACFHLRDLGKAAHHEWGWVLGASGFEEFIALQPDGSVALIVASDD
jgi:hypothetical protein